MAVRGILMMTHHRSQVEDEESGSRTKRVQACIFKVGDDCRQDVLALQASRLPSFVIFLCFGLPGHCCG